MHKSYYSTGTNIVISTDKTRKFILNNDTAYLTSGTFYGNPHTPNDTPIPVGGNKTQVIIEYITK